VTDSTKAPIRATSVGIGVEFVGNRRLIRISDMDRSDVPELYMTPARAKVLGENILSLANFLLRQEGVVVDEDES
jgi:hypothetical protein